MTKQEPRVSPYKRLHNALEEIAGKAGEPAIRAIALAALTSQRATPAPRKTRHQIRLELVEQRVRRFEDAARRYASGKSMKSIAESWGIRRSEIVSLALKRGIRDLINNPPPKHHPMSFVLTHKRFEKWLKK